jgi:hypothetical protein
MECHIWLENLGFVSVATENRSANRTSTSNTYGGVTGTSPTPRAMPLGRLTGVW